MPFRKRLEQVFAEASASKLATIESAALADRKRLEARIQEQLKAKSLFRTFLEPLVIQVAEFKNIPYPGFDQNTDSSMEKGIQYYNSMGKEGGNQWEYDEANYCSQIWWAKGTGHFGQDEELYVYMYHTGTVVFMGHNGGDRISSSSKDSRDLDKIEKIFEKNILRETKF